VGIPVVAVDASVLACVVVGCDVVDLIVVVVDSDDVISVESVVGFPVVSVDASVLACEVVECDVVDFVVVVVDSDVVSFSHGGHEWHELQPSECFTSASPNKD